jgi:hypothetical protein
MATTDFFRDEKPKPGESGGSTGGEWGTGGDGGIASGGGGGGSWGGGSDSDNEEWFAVAYWGDEGEDLIVVNAENVIMSDGTFLLKSACCMHIELEAQIKGNAQAGGFNHYDCIIVGAVGRAGEAQSNIFTGLLVNGEVDIYAYWQAGHYDHSEVNTIRFRVKDTSNTVTPWYTIPIGEAPGERVLTLKITDGILTAKALG